MPLDGPDMAPIPDEAPALPPPLRLAPECGKLVQDGGPLSPIKFIPHPDEKKKIEEWLAREMALAASEWEPVFAVCRENWETYKASKMQAADGTTMVMPAPLALVSANQKIAYAYNQLLRPRPIVSIDPYFPATYDIVVPMRVNQATGAPTTPDDPAGIDSPQMIPRSADETASTWELGLEYKLREKYGFPKVLYEVLTDAIAGVAPVWVKVCWEEKTRTVMQPRRTEGGGIDVGSREEVEIPDGEPLRVTVIPVFNCLLRGHETSAQTAEWFAERIPCSPDDFMAQWENKSYFLVTEEEDAKKLSKSTSAVLNQNREQLDATTQKKTPAEPRQQIDVSYVWFYRYVTVITEDPETGKKKRRRRKLSFLSEWHGGKAELLNSFWNPYDHQERPYEGFFEIKDPHTLSGSSTVGMVKYHQHVKTHLINAEVQNAFHANNFSYRVDPDSEFADSAKKGIKSRPGEIFFAKKDELEAFRAGAEHISLLQTVQYIDGDARTTTNESVYKTGEQIPGRTPAQTVAQVLEQGAQQPLMMLRTIAGGSMTDGFLRVIKLILLTERQYQPMGETLHIQDPETKEMLDVLYRYPVDQVLDNFRFAFTAVDEAEAAAHEGGQMTALSQMMAEDSKNVAEQSVLILSPNATPAMLELSAKMMLRSQAPLEALVSKMRRDTDAFTLTKEINALVEERKAAIIAAQQAATAMAAQGGMNGQMENPQVGGTVAGPDPSAAVPDGGGAVAGAPGLGTPPPAPPEGSGPAETVQ